MKQSQHLEAHWVAIVELSVLWDHLHRLTDTKSLKGAEKNEFEDLISVTTK